MPTYTEKCNRCSREGEFVMSISRYVEYRKTVHQCECGGILEPMIQATSFVLQGGCWAKDGYAGGKK